MMCNVMSENVLGFCLLVGLLFDESEDFNFMIDLYFFKD